MASNGVDGKKGILMNFSENLPHNFNETNPAINS
jgi:hypothetical protein